MMCGLLIDLTYRVNDIWHRFVPLGYQRELHCLCNLYLDFVDSRGLLGLCVSFDVGRFTLFLPND